MQLHLSYKQQPVSTRPTKKTYHQIDEADHKPNNATAWLKNYQNPDIGKNFPDIEVLCNGF